MPKDARTPRPAPLGAGRRAKAPPKAPRRKPAARAPAPALRGWCVYVLRCADGSLYTGATNDLARRVARHAAGQGARYTRSRLPVVLVHHEAAADRSAALRRERAVKRLRRAEKLALVGAGLSGRRALLRSR